VIKRRKRNIFLLLAGLMFVIVAACSWSSLYPWSKLNCVQRYIDVKTGRFRTVRFILYFQVSDTVEETPYSQVWEKYFGDYPEGEWHNVSALRGFFPDLSPEYAYLGAIFWEDGIMLTFDTAKFTEQDKEAIIKTFAQLMQGHPMEARRYSMDCFHFANQHHTDRDFITNAPSWLLDCGNYLSMSNMPTNRVDH
jgi:hypothetical protein